MTACGISRAKNPQCRIWPRVDALLERGNTLEQAEKIARADTAFMALVEAFYRGKYWNSCECEYLPSLWRYPVFSCAVNCGEVTAVGLLQKALGIKIDGLFGSQTRLAVKQCDKDATLDLFYKYWGDRYERIVQKDASQRVFLAGWHNRIENVKKVNHQ